VDLWNSGPESCACFAVVEVNVVDTSASKDVEDVTFPKLDPTRQSTSSMGGNSIRLTGDTIRELGADGWSSYNFPVHYSSVTVFAQESTGRLTKQHSSCGMNFCVAFSKKVTCDAVIIVTYTHMLISLSY